MLPKHAFILAFFLLNLLQATFTQLTGDEALYWMYWQKLDYGFRDHPPAIGVLIGFGYSLIKSELGVRLLIVLANTVTVMLTWKLAQPKQWWHFAILVMSIPVLNLYGFIATPDVPLLLSTALYFNVWKGFIEKQDLRKALLLGVCMAALVWSKYHGLLVILFSVLPLRNLWFKRYYWFAAATGIVLYAPHIVWQIVNDLPTIKFHINERNSDAWELKHILGYAAGQLGIFNPVVFGLSIYLMIRTRAVDDFERSLRWLITGLLVLFFFNSFRGRVEPHWTGPLAIAMIYLICRHWTAIRMNKGLISGLAFFIAALLFVRVALVVDFVPQLYRDFHRDKPKMAALHAIAGNAPVCFMNSYQNPSLYMFYTGGIAHSINNTEGGKNQYDYWDFNEVIDHKPFLFVASYDAPGFEKVSSGGFEFRIKRWDDLPVLHRVSVWADEWLHHLHPGDSAAIPAWAINRNTYPVAFTDAAHPISWMVMMNHKKADEANVPVSLEGLPAELLPGDSARIIIRFVVPDHPGKNLAYIAARVDDLPYTYQSNRLRIIVE
jgi:hypothetical protein